MYERRGIEHMLSAEARQLVHTLRYNDEFNLFEMHFEDWVERKKPYLFVMGLSGSDKSTYGHALSHLFDTQYLELNTIESTLIKRHGFDALNRMDERGLYSLYLTQIQRTIKHGIVEGVQLVSLDPSFFQDQPVVILNTSYLESTFRAWRRDKARRFRFKGLSVFQTNWELNTKLKQFIAYFQHQNTLYE
jgi:hypothetical protein